MLVHVNKIQRAFNRAAHSYELHARVQQDVGMALISTIPQTNYQHALDLGCGVGLATQQLLKSRSIEQLHATDISEASLQLAQKKLSQANIAFSMLDFDTTLPDHTFDLIFANMSLQWSENLHSLLQRIYAHLTFGGVMTFSIPLDGTFSELNNQFSLNSFHTFAAITAFLKRLNAEIIHSSAEFKTLHFHDTVSALRYIKQLGANHVAHRHSKSLGGKHVLRHSTINTLTYHIGYFTIRKPA